MDTKINFTLNGKPRTVTTDPDRSLLEVLGEDLQLTGTKFGCGEGQCRACSVLLNGVSKASCITSIGDVDKQEVVTIEGLANGDKLHPVQEAFLAEGAFHAHGRHDRGRGRGVEAESRRLRTGSDVAEAKTHLSLLQLREV